MNTGPSPEQASGMVDDDSSTEPMSEEGPNFEQFIGCAKELLDQGVTVGNLVDQLLEAQDAEPEESPVEPTPDTEGGIEPEVPMN